MSSNPFRIILTADINPGMEKDFEQAWIEVGGIITDHPANLGQWLMRDKNEPNIYYIISDWTDEPSFREFEHSEAHVNHRQKLQPYRRGGSMSVTQVVYALPHTSAGAEK